MATVKAIIRTTRKNTEVNIRFRLSDGRDVQLYHNSELSVNPDIWDSKTDHIKTRAIYSGDKEAFNNSVDDRKRLIISIYKANKDKVITSEILERLIDERLHPDKYKEPSDCFFGLFDLFIEKRSVDLSSLRIRDYNVLKRALTRYERFIREIYDKKFVLDIDKIDAERLEDIESYLRNEYALYKEYPKTFAKINADRKKFKPQQRGNNTLCVTMKRLRSFLNWCVDNSYTDNKSFDKYNGKLTEKYGTPYYLTLAERNKIADFDLSKFPALEIQRDIFIFQCLIGCRVSDLIKMRPENIINGAIEYIPHKTRKDRPMIVRVPLNDRAILLIDKYRDKDKKGRIFPFISSQKYNDNIKDFFKICGITRLVTVVDPISGDEVKRPINEIASSHMARRTFVGNLYKKVKDPNLVGSLSGHKEGSKAFVRYREIGDEIKTELVKMIE